MQDPILRFYSLIISTLASLTLPAPAAGALAKANLPSARIPGRYGNDRLHSPPNSGDTYLISNLVALVIFRLPQSDIKGIRFFIIPYSHRASPDEYPNVSLCPCESLEKKFSRSVRNSLKAISMFSTSGFNFCQSISNV